MTRPASAAPPRASATLVRVVALPAVLASAAGAALLLLLGTWIVSLLLRDVAIVDPVWGLAFVLIAWVAVLVGGGEAARGVLAGVLTTLWGGRLAWHLLRRKLREPEEDARYAAMRARHGARFPLVSLGTVFLLQAVLAWVVALPLQAAGAGTGGLGVLDGVGVAVWAVGLTFEAVGDRQLAAFKADPSSAGQVMDRGLWRYTRHPNYFGDACVWWGLGFIGLFAGGWWALIGPVVMTVLLVRVSGAGLMERTIGSRRPGYEDYVRRTSGFVPLPPKRT